MPVQPFTKAVTDKSVSNQHKQLDSLILLRGLAVLLVCLCHFVSPVYPDLKAVMDLFGRYGVHIFFVVSGFVIPLSLYKGKYIAADYGRFLYKRLLRLHLPYVMSVCLTYFIVLLSVTVRHVSTDETVLSFLQTLFYLHVPEVNGVYWTLLVEIQYYLFIGLLFPVLIKRPLLTCVFFLLIPFLNHYFFGVAAAQSLNFLAQSPFFFAGVAGFMLYAGIGHKAVTILTVIALFYVMLYTSPFADFVSSLFALLFILCYTYPVTKWLQFPGKISYSVYLIHFPLGYNLVGFLMMRTREAYQPWIVVIALLFVFATGYVFYLLFEMPSEAWSARVKYKEGHYRLHTPVKEQSQGEVEKVTVQ